MFLVTRFTGAPSRVPQDDGMPRLGIVVAMLVLWAVLVFGLLVWEPALFRAHVAQIVPPLALLASLRPPPWTVLLGRGGRGRAVLGRAQRHHPLAARVPRRRSRSRAAPAGAAG